MSPAATSPSVSAATASSEAASSTAASEVCPKSSAKTPTGAKPMTSMPDRSSAVNRFGSLLISLSSAECIVYWLRVYKSQCGSVCNVSLISPFARRLSSLIHLSISSAPTSPILRIFMICSQESTSSSNIVSTCTRQMAFSILRINPQSVIRVETPWCQVL